LWSRHAAAIQAWDRGWSQVAVTLAARPSSILKIYGSSKLMIKIMLRNAGPPRTAALCDALF
jgi:hypothetical protein